MGTIFSSGVGSGLDVAGLVSQLVTAEGAAPSARLDREEASLQAELSAFGSLRSSLDELRSALDSLQSLNSFRGRQVTLSGTDYLSATADSSSVPGSYDIEVELMASAHRLASDPYADADTEVGTGTLTVTAGSSGAFGVVIDSTNNTLAGIRDAINDASNNVGVLATIINGVDGSRLILSSSKTGVNNPITVTETGGDGGLAPLVYDPLNMITNMTEVDPAQDARILINGFAVESSSNSVSGAVDGLEIELIAENLPGETTNLSVSFDREGSREAVTGLVDAYNAYLDATAELTSFDVESETRGPLFGESILRSLSFQLRQEFTATITGLAGPFDNLLDIGITTDLDGKLSLDTAKLNAAFAEDFDAVGTLFADQTNGVANRLDALLDPYLATGGLLDARTDGIDASIQDISDRREALNTRLLAVEERLFRQFNALDTLLAELQSTSGFLTQQLDNLPGFTFFTQGNDR